MEYRRIIVGLIFLPCKNYSLLTSVTLCLRHLFIHLMILFGLCCMVLTYILISSLQKQFRYTKRPQTSRNEDASSQGSALIDDEIEEQEQKEVLDGPEQLDDAEKSTPSDNKAQRKPLADRIRVPVAYDDLFEEGEIHEGEPQNGSI